MSYRTAIKLAVVLMTIASIEVTSLASSAAAQDHTGRRRGAILGGLAGAALGVAIGDKGDNETAGALIGGAAGAVAGGVIGNQRDMQRRAQQPQPYSRPIPSHRRNEHPFVHPQNPPVVYSTTTPYQPTFVAPNETVISRQHPINNANANTLGHSVLVNESLSLNDVSEMSQTGMSDAMIIRQIQRRGLRTPLSVRDMIHLYNSGVSESVLEAMQH